MEAKAIIAALRINSTAANLLGDAEDSHAKEAAPRGSDSDLAAVLCTTGLRRLALRALSKAVR
jgi:hypothetical protein